MSFPSPYRELGLDAHSMTAQPKRRKAHTLRCITVISKGTGHLWNNPQIQNLSETGDNVTCRRCRQPRYIVGDRSCRSRRRK